MKHCTLTIIALLLCASSFAQGPISGPSAVCDGNTITLTNSTPGGTWTSSTSAVATVGVSTGIVTGLSTGVTTITYTVGASFVTHPVTVNPPPAAIGGPSSVCVGSSITLTNAVSGGTWSSSSISIAPIGAATGVLTGVSAGTTVVTYTLGTGCSTTKIITVNPSPGLITGPSSICAGGTTTTPISASIAGGTFTSSSISIAILGGTGLVTGVAPGTATITYTLPTGCASSKSFTVTPTPTVYTMTGGSGGTASFCSGGSGVSFGLSGSDPGVSYVLYQAGVGTAIGPITGTGSPLSFGAVTTPGLYCIMAYPSTSCLTIMNDSVTLSTSPLPATYTVTGGGSYCTGGSGVTVGLSSSSAGVTYQLYLGGTPVGTPVAGTGTAISFPGITTAGTYTIVATITTTGCSATMPGSAVVTVSSPPTITTSSTYPCGGAQTITASGGVSYSWAPTTGLSCSACGITDATPATTTTYTVTGTAASGCTNTATVSVNANRIAGQLTYTGGSSTDVFKVWLIQFNPSDSSITALDSTTTCMLTGSVPYYEFVSPAAGSYLVKAKLNGTIAGTSGYIPTYGLSTPNWYAAASVSHTSARDNMNISMIYGTVPSGPGFISGYVVAGAGKGTAGDIPEPGMLIYLYNTSGSMITYTYTDAAGVYSFTGLAAGTYYIYPEAHKYYTTPSATITLSTSSASAAGIGFRKSTTLGTIKPYDNTQILGVTTNATLAVYPVPTSRILNIEWPVTTTAHAGIVVRDMKGATVYNTEVDPAAADYHSELDLNTLPDGIYHITIRSSDIFYTSKLMIAH